MELPRLGWEGRNFEEAKGLPGFLLFLSGKITKGPTFLHAKIKIPLWLWFFKIIN
jgi:hypothetical protein